ASVSSVRPGTGSLVTTSPSSKATDPFTGSLSDWDATSATAADNRSSSTAATGRVSSVPMSALTKDTGFALPPGTRSRVASTSTVSPIDDGTNSYVASWL